VIDTHAHVLPGIDDGPATMAGAAAVCFAAAADGVETIVATPHQRHPMWPGNRAAAVAAACAALQAEIGERPRVVAGAEIRVDEDLLAEIDAYPDSGLLPLAGSRYLLLEFPTFGGSAPRPLLHELLVAGWRPVLAHAERIPRWVENPEELADLVALGAYVQITGGSVLGRFGRRIRACCAWLLDRNLVHFVGSDAHDTDVRPPGLAAAHQAITKGWGAAMADRLTRLNPADILADRPLPSLP
jgi:protein-tyrosine phosphatase